MPKTLVAIFVVLVLIAAIVVGWYSYGRPPKTPDAQKEARRERHLRKRALSLGEMLKNTRGQPGVDEERYNRAIDLLGNGQYDSDVVFYRCVLSSHPFYGPMLNIEFVDECAMVAELRFRSSGKEEQLGDWFHDVATSPRVERRPGGTYRYRHPLRSTDALSKPILSRDKADEPMYLYLTAQFYQAVVHGDGEIVLADKEGNMVDSLNLTKLKTP